LLIVAVAAGLILMVVQRSTTTPSATTTPSPTTKGKILEPRGSAPWKPMLNGTYDRLPSDAELWVVVEAFDKNNHSAHERYWIQGRVTERDSATWKFGATTLGLADPTEYAGRRYRIILYLVSLEAKDAVHDMFAKDLAVLDEVRTGMVELDATDVTRV
jgi:hypothetical protein